MAGLTFSQALEHSAVLARQALPPVQHERLSCAVALVKAGQVLQLDDHTWQVASQSDPDKQYSVNGSCGCEDSIYRAPTGVCKHVLATLLARKTLKLMQAPVPEPERAPAPAPDPEAAPSTVQGIDPRHIVMIQGQPFVKYAGLLDLAHRRGLQALRVQWDANTDELSLASATAVFPFGTYQESADASPTNVNRKVAPHFRRVALTRAAARALRNALNVSACSLEELGAEATD